MNIFGRDRYKCQYCGDEEGPFTIDHVGTNGTAPEAFIGVYPEEALAYADGGDDEPADEVTTEPTPAPG